MLAGYITLSERIEEVQRRATRWIIRCGKRGELTYLERLQRLDLLPLVYDSEIKGLIFLL